jgi:hypothetical protein
MRMWRLGSQAWVRCLSDTPDLMLPILPFPDPAQSWRYSLYP